MTFCPGLITDVEAGLIRQLLSERISQAASRGWFPEERGRILNEINIIDVDGQVYRPDRVVKANDRIIIVDYKFGEHYRKYEHQMRRYAQLWRKMGYTDVSAYLWYVQTDEVVEIA